jgi:FRG domain
MKQFEINSVEGFHLMLREHERIHSAYRGEDSVNYLLRPKYGRLQAKDPRNTFRDEQFLFEEFKRRGVAMAEHNISTDWEWLAVAQHFGLATRLLDWTENPLVAAYFATRNILRKGDRVIYIIDQYKFKHADEGFSPFEIEEVILYRPKYISSRISMQGGMFTVHPLPSPPLSDERVEKWVIRESCLIDIHFMLSTYGINEVSIFPGLEGLARFLNGKYIHGFIE